VTDPGTPGLPIEYEPALVEAAVLAALRGRPGEPAFRAERDPLYAIAEPEARETAFRTLHGRWFEVLGLGAVLDRALREQPAVATRASRCVVIRARSPGEEGGDLLVAAGAGPGPPTRTVLLRLRPESFLDPEGLRTRLRREILHVADVLDPAFGYTPHWPPAAGPLPPGLVRERYRVLWDTVVDGQMVRRGWAGPALRWERFHEFVATFPVLGARAGEIFGRLFDGPARHADLVALALDPGLARGSSGQPLEKTGAGART
jgi:hypothetical protein